MPSSKDHSKLTLEELVSKEKKLKSQRTMIAVFIGMLFGFAIWAATHHAGFLTTIFLLIFPLYFGNKHSQNLKSIQAEISDRGTD
jgi:uncharacterized membrane protein YbjE (DUF340 family)